MGRSPARGRKDQRSNGPQQPKAKRQAKGPKFLRGLTPPIPQQLFGRPSASIGPLDHCPLALPLDRWPIGPELIGSKMTFVAMDEFDGGNASCDNTQPRPTSSASLNRLRKSRWSPNGVQQSSPSVKSLAIFFRSWSDRRKSPKPNTYAPTNRAVLHCRHSVKESVATSSKAGLK